MFKQDEEIIKKLVAEHKGGDTSGDLFGLWTEDSEPVIHLVTGHSGMEKKSFKRSGTSTKIGDTEKRLEECYVKTTVYLVLVNGSAKVAQINTAGNWKNPYAKINFCCGRNRTML